MISIVTNGMFWPQAGHGVLSDAGQFGVDTYGRSFEFERPDMKASLVKRKEKSVSMKLRIEEER